jgi:hypothetical protein
MEKQRAPVTAITILRAFFSRTYRSRGTRDNMRPSMLFVISESGVATICSPLGPRVWA